MARATALPLTFSIFLLLLSNLVTILVDGEINQDFVRTLDRNLIGLKEEKLSHFRFYFHDTLSGKNPSAVQVVNSPSNTSKANFGAITMMDDPLTLGPNLSSKLVGRAQGFYAYASQEEEGLLVAMNVVFVEGKYNGSSITILGRDIVLSKVREMPVIGGSGIFRFARGYAQASTYTFNQTSGDAIVEYNVYVIHY